MVLPGERRYPKPMADIFDVISDSTRRELMGVLLERYVASDSHSGEISVGDLVERLGLSQPTVSKHLKVLRDHGLVTVREDGQHRYYRLDPAPLDELHRWLAPFGGGAAGSAAAEDGDEASPVYVAWGAGAGVGDRVGL